MEKHIILSAPGNEIRFYNEYESIDVAIETIKKYFGLFATQVRIKYSKDENNKLCAFVNIWNQCFIIRNQESYEKTKKERLTWTSDQIFRHNIMEHFKTKRFQKCYRIGFYEQGDFIDETKIIVSSIAHEPQMTYGAIETCEDAKILLAGLAAKKYSICNEDQCENACEGSIGYVVDSITAQMDALIDGRCTMPDGIVYTIIETFVLEPHTEDEWNDEKRFPLLYNSQCIDVLSDCNVGDISTQIKQYRTLLSKVEHKIQSEYKE